MAATAVNLQSDVPTRDAGRLDVSTSLDVSKSMDSRMEMSWLKTDGENVWPRRSPTLPQSGVLQCDLDHSSAEILPAAQI
jgi:hypothetical protein